MTDTKPPGGPLDEAALKAAGIWPPEDVLPGEVSIADGAPPTQPRAPESRRRSLTPRSGGQPYHAGREARRVGAPLESNPYPPGSFDARAWATGWQETPEPEK